MSRYSQNFYDSVSNRAIQSAQTAANVIFCSIVPNSLIDIGSGQGVWLRSFSKKFETVSRTVALDLQPHESSFFDELRQSGTNFEFIEVDFEISSKLPEENFDIAICLEVLEHLTTETAIEVAKEIGRKCSLVIFSAAITGQGGTGHINERKFSYWMDLMRSQGFVVLDVFRPALGKSQDVPGYYKQNMVLCWHPKNARKNGTKFDLEALLEGNTLEVRDNRSYVSRIRYALVALIPTWVVTGLVKILDKTIRKSNQQQ